MFRVIHPNRWFFWTIAILVGTGLVILIYIYQTIAELDRGVEVRVQPAGESISDPSYFGWKLYR